MVSNRKDFPDFLNQLDRYGHDVRRADQNSRGRFDLFLIDLSEWKLRFSERTPLILIPPGTLSTDTSSADLFESLQDVVKERSWQHRECLVLLDGDGKALKAITTRRYFPRFVIIDHADQERILNGHSFTGGFLDVISEQLSLTSLSPYQISAPVRGSSFFGRQRELNRILSHTESNFAIVGIRRLGKSSVLREVQRMLIEQQGTEERCLWLDCSTLNEPEEFVREIVRNLRPQEMSRIRNPDRLHFFLPNFLKRMSRMYGGPITIFLDEADNLLLWTRKDWGLLEAIRNSVNDGACRYLAAGYQYFLDELYNNSSPFYLAFEPIYLKPFARRDTADLLLQPMQSMRVRFENEAEVVNRLQNDTSGHPQLVQFCCMKLIDLLEETESRIVTPESLASIYGSDEFKAQVVNSFRNNVEPEDKLLVYTILTTYSETKQSFNQKEMYDILARIEFYPTTEEIDRVCDRLVLAGVFNRDGGQYQFTMPIFPQIMRANYNLDHLWEKTKEEVGL